MNATEDEVGNLHLKKVIIGLPLRIGGLWSVLSNNTHSEVLYHNLKNYVHENPNYQAYRIYLQMNYWV